MGPFSRWTRPSRWPVAALPGLKQVGIAWNPAESNSAAFTVKARETCRTLGLTLLEANVENTSGVAEAVRSLASRGAQALFVGGDNTMMSAIAAAIAAARTARIPVFTIMPGAADRGTLFDVGLDFHELGRLTGVLAARVLGGLDPATLPIRDVLDEVPRRLDHQHDRRSRAPRTLELPPDVLVRSATVLVDDAGVHERAAATTSRAGAGQEAGGSIWCSSTTCST